MSDESSSTASAEMRSLRQAGAYVRRLHAALRTQPHDDKEEHMRAAAQQALEALEAMRGQFWGTSHGPEDDAANDKARAAIEALRTALAQPNQCDGCCAGMPLDGGMHRDGSGRPVMLCQAHRYEL